MSSRSTVVLGAGCFWCVEAVFEQFPGILDVESGYSGGSTPSPTYDQVCSGNSGHAEVARITFDPSRITFERILEIFWTAHDPTTLNRQGGDVGTQYRSVIFYQNEAERVAAENSKRVAQSMYRDPVVTEISPLREFFAAEKYHQDYYQRNQSAPYCQFVIRPKLEKLRLDPVGSPPGEMPRG